MQLSDVYSTATTAILDALGDQITRAHAAELAASRILPNVAKLRGYRSITAQEAHSVLCIGYVFAKWQAELGSGLVLPIHPTSGGPPAAAMFKPDSPRLDKGKRGKLVKYESAAGSRLQLDVPPICQPDLGNPKIDKFICEGIKKADCLASLGKCAISLQGGVWGWLGTNLDGGKTALPDWRDVALNDGGRVFLCFDSDAVTKASVAEAEKQVAAYLAARGARVFVIRIPQPAEGADARE